MAEDLEGFLGGVGEGEGADEGVEEVASEGLGEVGLDLACFKRVKNHSPCATF